MLNIAGLQYLARASLRVATQKSASRVLLSLQLRTFRLAQSMIATRYRNPVLIGMYVASGAPWTVLSLILDHTGYPSAI